MKKERPLFGKTEEWIDRDISWLQFNERVLLQLLRKDMPISKRVSFIGIAANNMMEFISVRLATHINAKNKTGELVKGINEQKDLIHDYFIQANDELDLITDVFPSVEDDKFNDGLKAEFKPLKINDYSDTLLHFGEIRLFMTGTLGSKDKFCEWIGIDPKETYYIFVKSPFPKSNRPIIKSYVGSMSGRKGRNPNWRNPAAIQKINEIIKKHQHEKGVIHTSSNQQAWFIKKMLNSKKVWVAQGSSREDTIRRFESANGPVVLVGAGLKDGVDFKGDKCRYQIMFKMPYPSLAGKQVNIRMHYDNSWYAYQTIMPLMQAYGRGIRDNNDYCVLYVLDSDFDRLLNQYHHLFNEYFLEAIHKRKPKQIKPIPIGGK
jgi:Rad3-related DNA helicase